MQGKESLPADGILLRPIRAKYDKPDDRYTVAVRIYVGKYSHTGELKGKRYPHASVYYDGSAYIYGSGGAWPSYDLVLSKRTLTLWLSSEPQPTR